MNAWIKPLALTGSLLAAIAQAGTQVEPEAALELLAAQDHQFERQVVKVADNVFTAEGFHGANTSMIVGDDGVIIVDTLRSTSSAKTAMNALRKHSDKPVKAIIYTHSHGDHIGGASAFLNGETPDIYATSTFGSAEGVNKVANPVKGKRNIRQFGRDLPPEQTTNRGVAPANTDSVGSGAGYLEPTIFIAESGTSETIAGVELEFHLAPGETDDAMFIWMPKERVLFAGDNFYHSFPNLYAIRGTAYRDVLKWSKSVTRMAEFEPDALVPGHTLPLFGRETATTALRDYGEAIRSVYEQTVEGINAGKSPDQIAHEVQLPERLRNKSYLTEYYGTIPHAVRAIYTGLLGWYDGNPTTLNPLPPKEEARAMAELAGGPKALADHMERALAENRHQWALELADHVKWLDGADRERVRAVKIQALRALAEREYNAPNRNYYLSYANELESGALSEIWF